LLSLLLLLVLLGVDIPTSSIHHCYTGKSLPADIIIMSAFAFPNPFARSKEPSKESDTNGSNSSTSLNKDSNSSGNGKHRPRPLKTVMAALTVPFDHVHLPTFGKLRARKLRAEEKHKLEKMNGKHVKINTILHGTMDPDGAVQDVFYDAVEFGDGDHGDEFKLDFRRESVVLHNILANVINSDEIEAVLEEPEDRLIREQSERDLAAGEDGVNAPLPPHPKPPKELPLRFLLAGKGNVEEGLKRYEATLEWRKEEKIDYILREPSPNFALIKQHYPHYYHGRGRAGECCYYEQPPKTNLKALKEGGVTIDALLHHYAMVTEFQWQMLERDDLARSITIIDLEGIRFMDFAGEVIDFVKRASAFTGQHYPERAGLVFVINVPGWFKVIWSVVKPMVDDVTLQKIYILRGKEEVRDTMEEWIAPENIPIEYGGTSTPLGTSPEEKLMADLMDHNNALARGEKVCTGSKGSPPCRFCSWVPARSY
jgi:hypothetical protein